MYSPTGSANTHLDKVLTNISVGWPNNGFVGENLFPSVPVVKQSDKYYVFGREAWKPEDDLRAPGTVANEIAGAQVSLDTYYCQEHALQHPVTDEERKNVDNPLNPDRDATEMLTSKIMLGREVAMKNLVQTAANYGTSLSVTLAGVTQWSDYTNSDPILNMRTAKSSIHARIFLAPNIAIFPYQVMTILEDHPDFIERIKYSERGIVTRELIASIIGVNEIIVPGVGINNAALGQAASLGYLWGKDVVFAYVPPRPGLKVPAFGYEFTWNEQYIDRWREGQRKSDLIRCQRSYDLKLVAQGDPGTADAGKAIAGYLIKAAVA
jgi:hypothetical protein